MQPRELALCCVFVDNAHPGRVFRMCFCCQIEYGDLRPGGGFLSNEISLTYCLTLISSGRSARSYHYEDPLRLP